MRELLGRGGMGEVWRAFDLKLRVDVALKSVRAERVASRRAHELLRQEVRSAREVVSPNVCRIFDLVEEEGRELVSMEYIDGTTLTETLRSRGPLELQAPGRSPPSSSPASKRSTRPVSFTGTSSRRT